MARLFFLLSGEHPTLPQAELQSILKAEAHEYRILEKLAQVLRLETSSDSVKSVKSRSAMTRVCGLELLNCHATIANIKSKMGSTSLDDIIERDEAFVVRVRRVRGSASPAIRVELERKLGELILSKAKGTKVSLKKPQKTFFGILTEDRFIFGLKTADILPKPFMARGPRKRPFFHPSAMPAKLARCMVNLAQPKEGELVLDPFCGTATMLVEAGLIGCRVIGFDIQSRMVKGSLQNLLYYGVEPEGMVVADAKHLPIANTDCIVTDPPYGKLATTLGWNTRQIVEDTLSMIDDKLPKGRRICMASPKSIQIGEIGEQLGFKRVESHFVYVHRSLTREIIVFERT
ncbi:MAG: N-6 DNA methylase [Candidatus Bathyarchaeota archaeon]|nr:MAG: N-6 DNA methylase [Candidatus Bathyarchaeota archaeon]